MDIDLGLVPGPLRGVTGPTFWQTAGPERDLSHRFSRSFMAAHTQFDSFDEFRATSPWDVADAGELQRTRTDRLDGYVASTTVFEGWEEMKLAAAVDDLVELFGVRRRW